MFKTQCLKTNMHHVRVPDVDYTWDRDSGRIDGRVYNYFTCGAAISEVEIDCLTGDHVVLRSDVVMDLGRSLNPAVDIGQVENLIQVFVYTL